MRTRQDEQAAGGPAERYFREPARRLAGQWPALRSLALQYLGSLVVVEVVFLVLAELAARTVYSGLQSGELGLMRAIYAIASPPLTLGFLALTTIGQVGGTLLLTLAFAWLLLIVRRSAV